MSYVTDNIAVAGVVIAADVFQVVTINAEKYRYPTVSLTMIVLSSTCTTMMLLVTKGHS